MKDELGDAESKKDNARRTRALVVLSRGSFRLWRGVAVRIVQMRANVECQLRSISEDDSLRLEVPLKRLFGGYVASR